MTINDIFKDLLDPNFNIEAAHKAMEAWQSWYKGYVQSFHRYTIYNGTNKIEMQMKTLHMAKMVCEDWANFLFNEKVLISVDDEKTNARLAEIRKELNFDTIMNKGIEKAFASGLVGYVISVDEDDSISLENVNGLKIYPLTMKNGRITECAFLTTMIKQGHKYVFASCHKKNAEGEYYIDNALYQYQDDQGNLMDEPTSMWRYETRSQIPWFSIFSPNAVNNLDEDSPFGISVFANSISTLKQIDNTYDAMNNEVSIGRMRIMVSSDLTHYDADGEHKVFDPKDTAYQVLPKGLNEKNSMEVVAPTLRTEALRNTLNTHLALLSREVGFDSGYYYMDQHGQVKTATEVISNDSHTYKRMQKHEIPLEETVRTLIQAILDIYTRIKGESLPYTDITIHFDDSIIQDKEAERAQDGKDIALGIMSKVEYRMKWYGEDEETARAAVEEASEIDASGEGD